MAEMPAPSIDTTDDQTQKKTIPTNCVHCENAFSQENLPKLLPCLHTCCQSCILPSESENEEADKEKEPDESTPSIESTVNSGTDKAKPKKPACPVCHQEFRIDSLIDNPFVTVTVSQDPRTSEDGSPSAQKFPICTSCDENQKASSFCVECQEWLCDPCVVAHKRVRITKDHTFSSKVEQEDSALDTSVSKQVFCDIHKTEKMKLFCLSCDKLTCRDCQLLEHKDHKYQFIEETIADQKKNLLKSVQTLKARIKSNEKVADKIAAKEKDIKRQQVDVFNEVRQVADQITNDLIRWCKQLLNFLQGVCNCRTRDLSLKKQEFDDFADKAKNCIEFVEYAIESGNDMNILSVKGLMDNQLKSLLGKDISIQDSMFELNIKYENDVGFLKKNVSKMGFINVNGKSYPTNNQHTASPKPESAAPTKPTANVAAASSSSSTPSTISRAVAELLNMYPTSVRENYKSMNSEQRRAFLQRLVTGHIKNRGASNLLTDLASYLNVGNVSSTQQSHSSDSNAIQELYRISQQRPQHSPRHPENSHSAPDQAQRTGGPSQNYPNYRGDNNQQPVSSPTALGPFPGAQPGFNWLGYPGPRPQNYYYNRPNHTLTSPTSTVPSGNLQGGQMGGPGFPQNAARPQAPVSRVPVASGVPPGRFNIDPLNLRLKQEPRDDGQFGRSSCQYAPPGNLPRVLQSPTSSVSPALRASPGTLDGGQRASESPALPDVNVMDSDRNAILQNLNHNPGRPFNVYNLNIKHDPSDPSEDYCAVCHNGGDLLCCDRCPKVFHLQCHIPAISASLAPSDQWTCTMCVPEEEVTVETLVTKEFEITSTGKRKAPSGLTDKELKACERVLLELFCQETSTCFHEPVSKQVPNYYKIITNPMDFGSIKCKLRRGHFNHYNTVEEFLSDIKLVFKNCYTYNSPASEIYGVGKSIEAFLETLVQTYLPCYLDFIHRDVPSPAGSSGSLEPNGDAPRQKKRKSPAPDANRDSPLNIS